MSSIYVMRFLVRKRQDSIHSIFCEVMEFLVDVSLAMLFYPELNLVVEYKDRQHFEPLAFYDKDKEITVSRVSRGEQRRIYDQHRRDILPDLGIWLVEI